MASKKRPGAKARRPPKKLYARKRSSTTKRAVSAGKAKHTRSGKGASISSFATQALAVFTQGVEQQLEALANKQVPTVAVINGEELRGVPQRIGKKYVLVAAKPATGIAGAGKD
jgi:hypothetical protein